MIGLSLCTARIIPSCCNIHAYSTQFYKENTIWISFTSYIYIIITKNIRYLLWNRGVWRFFHDTYLTIEVQGIRCTNHLHDSCPFTDVNPHFTAPGCRYYFKINSSWPIVTSSTHGPAASNCDVTMAHCLWTHDVEVGVRLRDCDNLRSPKLFGTWLHLFAYRGRMIHYGTLGHQTIDNFGLICLFTLHFRTPVFQHGASLVLINNTLILPSWYLVSP